MTTDHLNKIAALETTIDELKNALAKAKIDRNFLINEIINKMPGNIYWLDCEGNYLGMNDNHAEIFHLQRQDILHHNNYHIMPEEHADIVRETNQKIMQDNKPATLEEIGFDINGKTAFYFTQKRPLHDADGNVVGLLGISVDITKLKDAEYRLLLAKEYAEKQSREKSELIMNLSHDIRTPFNGIIGFAEMLTTELSDPHQQQKAQYILQSSQHLLAMLDEMVNLSQMDVAEIKQHVRPFSLNKLINKIVAVMNASLARKKLNLKINIDAELPPQLVSNQYQLEKILLNLVGNAIKYTEQGGITISASLANKNDDDATLVLNISDTGIGIPEDKLEIIFERFSRLHSSHQGKYEGLGLGLFVTKQMIEALGGTIKATSALNKGSTFTLQLPIKLPVNATKPIKEAPSKILPNVKITKPNPRVLLVEDDLISQKVAHHMLCQLNCQVTLAKNAKEAIVKINADHYDLILLDMGLPDLNGGEIAKPIRTTHNTNQHTPIVALTAQLTPPEVDKPFMRFIDAFLQKPITLKLCRQLLGQS